MTHFDIFRTGARAPKLLLALCLFIALGATAVGARHWAGADAPTAAARATAIPATPPAAQTDVTHGALSVEVVTITPSGFEPAKLNPAKGRFILAVANRSGQPDVELELLRETGHKLHEVRVPRELADWSDVVDLHPGRYVLRVAGRPEWECDINVSAK